MPAYSSSVSASLELDNVVKHLILAFIIVVVEVVSF